MTKALDTRRLYHFDRTFINIKPARRIDTPIAKLRALARRVWEEQDRHGWRCPDVVAGKGTPDDDGDLVSYYFESRIVLARDQRNVPILLHELTHALGHGTHGKGFVRRYFELLTLYGGFNPLELVAMAESVGIKL